MPEPIEVWIYTLSRAEAARMVSEVYPDASLIDDLNGCVILPRVTTRDPWHFRINFD